MFKRVIIGTFLLLLLVLAACGRERQIIIEDYIEAPHDPTDEAFTIESQHSEENPTTELPPPVIETPPYNDYIVHLEIDTDTRTVQGISRINFTNRSDVPLDTVVLRVFLNAFSEGHEPRPYFPDQEWRLSRRDWERGFGYMDIQYASIDNMTLGYMLNGTVLTLHPTEPIMPNATVQLLLQYNAYVPRIASRTGGNDLAMWFGMFLPVLAVHGENGWYTDAFYPAGEPFFLETANYHVSITTPIRYTVAGTGLRTEEVIEDTDTRITHFTAHMVRDFAFAISTVFNHAHIATESGIDIHLYYHTEGLRVDHIMKFSKRSMEYFEAHVGRYPFGQVSIVEADLIGDIAAFSQIVFVDTRQFFQNLRWLAHGLGNQWFANVVGSNRVAEPWLDEGLMRFVQAGIFYETPEALRERIEWEHDSIADRENLYINRGLGTYTSRQNYAYAQGRKAMVMLYALCRRMGDENFWRLINQYYDEFAFGIATTEDFIRIAEDIYGESLHAFFYEWMETGTVPALPPRLTE